MKAELLCSKIRTDENLMETAAHGSAVYPFRFYLENIAQFDFHCVDWHWHTELERLKHCNLSTIPKKGAQNQAPQKRAKNEVMLKD